MTDMFSNDHNSEVSATAVKAKSTFGAPEANADAGALNALKTKIQQDHGVDPAVANKIANKVYKFKSPKFYKPNK